MKDEVEMKNQYEYHIFELRDEKFHVKKTITVIAVTFAVAKRKPEKKKFRFVRYSYSSGWFIENTCPRYLSYQSNL